MLSTSQAFDEGVWNWIMEVCKTLTCLVLSGSLAEGSLQVCGPVQLQASTSITCLPVLPSVPSGLNPSQWKTWLTPEVAFPGCVSSRGHCCPNVGALVISPFTPKLGTPCSTKQAEPPSWLERLWVMGVKQVCKIPGKTLQCGADSL